MRPFCSGVSSGCHSGPRAVFGFSRDCSDALFGREAVEAFVPFFLVCCFSRFAAHTFLGGRAPARRKAGPWVLALTPHPSEGGRPCPSRAAGTQTPACSLGEPFLLLVFVWATGAREPCCFCWGGGCVTPRLPHALFSPGLSLSLSFSVSLGLFCLAFGKEEGEPCDSQRLGFVWNFCRN